ncbi:MAG: hypothetical protein JW730_21300, partial [Anaerolineales bacterium]|nr:hypothetical protein [Anaerolineales bacterium]
PGTCARGRCVDSVRKASVVKVPCLRNISLKVSLKSGFVEFGGGQGGGRKKPPPGRHGGDMQTAGGG